MSRLKMCKGQLLFITLMALFLCLSAVTNVSATIRYVPSDFTTIQAAVNAANPGDTVYIMNGTYTVPLSFPVGGAFVRVVKDNLTIKGQSRDGVILVGRSNKSGAAPEDWIKGIHVMADNVTIKDLTVQGFKGGTDGAKGFGIVFDDFDGGPYQDGRVENVKLQNNGVALRAMYNQNMTVADSLIQNNVDRGLDIAECDTATITGNTVISGAIGIWASGNNVTIAGNIVTGARDSGIYVNSAELAGVTISGNDVSKTGTEPSPGDGIEIADGDSVTVTENLIHDNVGGVGIRITGDSSDIQLICNTITKNAVGVKVGGIGGTITNSRFDLNNIYGNTTFGAHNATDSPQPLLNFENAWWGCTAGPVDPACDSVSENVDSTHWLTAKKDMFWKDYNGKAPGGYMPDFDQNQNFDNAGGPELNYCSPTATADSIWWLSKKHNLNLNLIDYNLDGQVNILDLVQELAWLMDTNGQRTQIAHDGTLPIDQKNGITQFLVNHKLDNVLYAHMVEKPTFAWIEEEVKSCQNVKLDLGFWVVTDVIPPTGQETRWHVFWTRFGGHAVDVAGVDSNNSLIAISDPAVDSAEVVWPGIVRGLNHDHPTGHNDAASASHDIVKVKPSPSPGGLFGLVDLDGVQVPYWNDFVYLEFYYGNNGGIVNKDIWYTKDPNLEEQQIYTEIEAAVVISPRILVVKPNGGEVMHSGSNYTIKWSSIPAAVKFNLKYSIDNGTTWKILKNGVMGTSYVWTVPAPPNTTDKCLVKVIGYDASGVAIGVDTSDSTFTIKVVELVSPSKGETLTSGDGVPNSDDEWQIIWNAYTTIRAVKYFALYYSLTGTAPWTKIAEASVSPESPDWFIWEVPKVTIKKTTCKVRLVLKDSSGIVIGSAVSEYFTIKPAP